MIGRFETKVRVDSAVLCIPILKYLWSNVLVMMVCCSLVVCCNGDSDKHRNIYHLQSLPAKNRQHVDYPPY